MTSGLGTGKIEKIGCGAIKSAAVSYMPTEAAGNREISEP